ncbi:MAG: glycosyltransferase family 2 protein [bacterium]|nr:glycosyltransferase family 2 protein [bacterium]
MKLLSIVVPCFNEEEVLPLFFKEVSRVLADIKTQYQAEIVFVDDGSKDHTLNVLQRLASESSIVRYLSFSRNFGKEAAMYAGLEHAKGDYVVIMDADLQDPPSLLPQMLHAIEKEGYDSVATRRVTRKGEPPIRSFFARMFYKIMNKMSDVEIMDGARDYRMMTRNMVDGILSMGEYNRFSKGIFGWVGYSTKWLPYENIERAAGETKWSFWKLFAYSIEGIVAFSTLPLSIATIIGLVFCGIAFLMVLVIFGKTMLFGDPVGGWPSLACMILFVGGTQLFCLGVIGKYLSKTYLETKQRPKYLLRETNETRSRQHLSEPLLLSPHTDLGKDSREKNQ